MEVGTGLCGCGCGLPAPIAKKTNTRAGWVKGAPMKFIASHNGRNRPTKQYRFTMVNGKLRKMHHLRAEAALGKPLPPGAVVHHADGSKNEDAPLVICENQAYHMLLHHRTRIVRAGGNPNTDMVCGRCKQVRPLTAFPFSRGRVRDRYPVCRECGVRMRRERKGTNEAS